MAPSPSTAIPAAPDAAASPDAAVPPDAEVVDPEASAHDIFFACEAGRLDVVRELLASDPSLVRSTKPDGDTPLHWAARARGKGANYVEVTRELLRAGAVVDARNENQDTPLLAASFNDNFERVKLLIDGGADVDAPNQYGWTPLYSAISFGNDHGPSGLDIAVYLIDKGADINVRGDDNWTLLHMAIKKLGEGDASETRGYQRVIDMLARGVDDIDAVDDEGNAALHVAADEGLEREVSLLTREGCALDTRNRHGRTPLHLAVSRGHARVACYLASIGADASIPDANGFTAKMEAENDEEITRCIMENEREEEEEEEEEEVKEEEKEEVDGDGGETGEETGESEEGEAGDGNETEEGVDEEEGEAEEGKNDMDGEEENGNGGSRQSVTLTFVVIPCFYSAIFM